MRRFRTPILQTISFNSNDNYSFS
ncbi:protein of unknown function [Burkholderia multivorans]